MLHPDKNDADDAEVKFRWLVAINEVLKDKEKRAIYDRVLVEGLPDWRTPVFYYRRMRKMGLAEGLAYLFAIVTVCQYLMNRAAYWERSFTLGENLNAQKQKMAKKRAKTKGGGGDEKDLDAAFEEHRESVLGPKPTVFDTLPFQMFRGGKAVLFALPTLPSTVYGMYQEQKEKKEEEERLRREEEEEAKRVEEKKQERKEQRQKRKKVSSFSQLRDS